MRADFPDVKGRIKSLGRADRGSFPYTPGDSEHKS
jgi:hypothetical protein